MGAALDYVIYRDDDRGALASRYERDCDSDGSENGRSYSGTIAMTRGVIDGWHDEMLPDDSAAIDFIDSHAVKWEGAQAVSYGEGDQKFWVIGGVCSS
jgi:hypothetical protein